MCSLYRKRQTVNLEVHLKFKMQKGLGISVALATTLVLLSGVAVAQDAKTVAANAAKAMADKLNTIQYRAPVLRNWRRAAAASRPADRNSSRRTTSASSIMQRALPLGPHCSPGPRIPRRACFRVAADWIRARKQTTPQTSRPTPTGPQRHGSTFRLRDF